MTNHITIDKQRVTQTIRLYMQQYAESWRGCAGYAFFGALLLNYIAGECLYYPVAGTLNVKIGTDEIGPCYLTFDAHEPKIKFLEYHAWIVRLNVDKQAEEFIDFSSHHYPKWAKTVGFNWERESFPEVIWDDPEKCKQLEVYFSYHPETTMVIFSQISQQHTQDDLIYLHSIYQALSLPNVKVASLQH